MPYTLYLSIAGIIALPFYFFNKYLQKKIKPRSSGKKLLLFFGITILSAFAYMYIVVYLMIWAVKFIK